MLDWYLGTYGDPLVTLSVPVALHRTQCCPVAVEVLFPSDKSVVRHKCSDQIQSALVQSAGVE